MDLGGRGGGGGGGEVMTVLLHTTTTTTISRRTCRHGVCLAAVNVVWLRDAVVMVLPLLLQAIVNEKERTDKRIHTHGSSGPFVSSLGEGTVEVCGGIRVQFG